MPWPVIGAITATCPGSDCKPLSCAMPTDVMVLAALTVTFISLSAFFHFEKQLSRKLEFYARYYF